MKPTSVLISSSVTIADIHGRLQEMGSYVEREFFDTLVVEGCVLGVDASGTVLSEYEDDEIDYFRSRFGDVAALLLEYESVTCFQRVVSRAVEGFEGMIDDSSGELKEFFENFGEGTWGGGEDA